MADEELISVGNFLRLYEAEIAQGVLDSVGIWSHIPDKNVAAVAPHYLFGTGGVRLLVRLPDAETARAALEVGAIDGVGELESEDLAGDDDSPEEQIPSDRAKRPLGLRHVAVVILLVSLGIAVVIAIRWHVQATPPLYARDCWGAWKSSRWEEAIEVCSRVTIAAPRWEPGCAFLSVALSVSGKHDDAITAAKRSTNDPTGLCYLAWVLKRAGRTQEAQETLREFEDNSCGDRCSLVAAAGTTPVVSASVDEWWW